MVEEILHEIAVTGPITFLIQGKQIPSGVLFNSKKEPNRYIMLCKYYGNNGVACYKIHTYNNSLNEVDCESFDNLVDFYGAVDVDNLLYSKLANDLVLEKAKQRISHLTSAKAIYEC